MTRRADPAAASPAVPADDAGASSLRSLGAGWWEDTGKTSTSWSGSCRSLVDAPVTGRSRPHRVRGTALVLGVGVLLAGCTSGPEQASPSPSAPLPCAEGGSHAELGATRRGEAHAQFTTAGGTVHVAVRYFPRGGLFESDGAQAAVYVGDAATPPTYDEQSGVVGGVTAETSVREGAWGELELEPGRYWIWVSTGSDVVVAGCEPGSVTEPAPVAAGG